MIDVRWEMPDSDDLILNKEREDLQARSFYQQDQPIESYAVPADSVVPEKPLLLMSAGNPDGWKLEELLDTIRAELLEKNARLARDAMFARTESPFGGTHALSRRRTLVRENVHELKKRIAVLLMQASVIQRELMAELATLGPDLGPRHQRRV